MVGLFIRLKLRLLRNSMRSLSTAVGMLLFTALTLTFGGSMGLIFFALNDRARLAVAPLVGAVIIAGWILGPMLFGASDETIDTTRLAPYGLDPKPLAGGMAAAAVVGPGPIAAMLPLVGLAARADGVFHTLLALVAGLVTIVFATSASRLALTSLGAGLRKRKSRDRATLIAGLGAGAVGVAGQLFALGGTNLGLDDVENLAAIVRLTPFGWSGDAIGRAAAGQTAIPLIELAATGALIVVILRAWVDVLHRVLENVEESIVETDVGGPLMDEDRPGPNPVVGTVLAKERRYLQRHPRYRVQVVSQGIVLIVGGAPFIGAVIERDPRAVLLGCIPGLTAGITGSNLLGPDGRALWGEVISLPSLRPVLRGRSLAFALLGLGSAALITLAVAAWTGGWQYAPVALGAAVGLALTGAGIGTITSVLAPTPFPDDDAPNPFATNTPGGGCVNGLITIVGVFFGLLCAAPVLVGIALARDSFLAGALVTVLSPAYGAAIWAMATGLAGRRADRRAPELISALTAI